MHNVIKDILSCILRICHCIYNSSGRLQLVSSWRIRTLDRLLHFDAVEAASASNDEMVEDVSLSTMKLICCYDLLPVLLVLALHHP